MASERATTMPDPGRRWQAAVGYVEALSELYRAELDLQAAEVIAREAGLDDADLAAARSLFDR